MERRERRTFISWLSFATGELLPLDEKNHWEHMLRTSIGSNSTIAYYTGGQHLELHAALKALQLHLRSRFNLREIPRKEALADAGSVTNEQLARSAKGFIANYDQTLIKKIACGKAKKLAKYLEVPAGEEIFLHHSGETAGDERNGFAVTAGGFYCPTETRPICTDWQTFFMGTLETGMDEAKRYVVCCQDSSGADRGPIVRFQWIYTNTTAADACILIIHLQDYLRKRYA